MSHYSFHDETFLLFSLKFYFIGSGRMQGQRVETKGQEMNRIEMHDVKDTRYK